MKARLVICMMVLLVVAGGCLESFALIGGGAAGGMTIARILDQQQKVIQEDIAMMETEKADLEQQLAEATDEAEKEKIQQQITNTEAVLTDLKDANEAIARAKEGLDVDWKNPMSVIPFAGAVFMTAYGIWQRRKKNEEATKRAADKAGREKTLREIAALTEAEITAPVVKSLMYNNIGEARRAIT